MLYTIKRYCTRNWIL